jgi:hypothetical protein
MVNAFYEERYRVWQLATKQRFADQVYGATTYSDTEEKIKLTIEDIFVGAFKKLTGQSLSGDLLNKEYCYSFVLQHPSNYVVVPCKSPKLTLVAVYKIAGTTIVNVRDAIAFPPGISGPIRYNLSKCDEAEPEKSEVTYTELIEKYASMNAPCTVVGLTIFHRLTGERCKIRNPAYETIRHLKGADPKLLYRYLSLRTNSETSVEKYVQEFPEYKNKFTEFRDQLYLFTQTLYENYVKCYIKREIEKENIPQQFKMHLSNLHSIYLRELVHKKLYIKLSEVIKYVNGLHPSQIIHSMMRPVTGK